MRRFMLALLGLAVCLAVPHLACGNEPRGEPSQAKEKTASWFDVKEILDKRCMQCHNGPGASSGVNLNNYQDLTRPEPRNASELPTRTTGRKAPGTTSSRATQRNRCSTAW